MSQTSTLLLVAGEASGDIHGAELIRNLLRQSPDLKIIGAGGPRMAAAGQEQLFDLAEHAVVGLVEVAKHYPKLRALFERILRLARTSQPQAVIFIDYPGFNLRLAAKLRKLLPNTKLIYYISPQVWAWKSGRALTMAKILDLMLVIFEFEKEWYAQKTPSLKVEWVGHPLFDRIISQKSISPVTQAPGEVERIALLPGSRLGELRKHLPVLIETARLIHGRRPRSQFVWIAPDLSLYEQGLKILEAHGAGSVPLESYVGYPLSHLSRCDFALLASGTVSLECAVLNVPQIVFYKVNGLTYQIGKRIVKIKYLSMVNVLARRLIVPEFIQTDLAPETLAERAVELLSHPSLRQEMNAEVQKVVGRLGGPGASERAAKLILAQLPAS